MNMHNYHFDITNNKVDVWIQELEDDNGQSSNYSLLTIFDIWTLTSFSSSNLSFVSTNLSKMYMYSTHFSICSQIVPECTQLLQVWISQNLLLNQFSIKVWIKKSQNKNLTYLKICNVFILSFFFLFSSSKFACTYIYHLLWLKQYQVLF